MEITEPKQAEEALQQRVKLQEQLTHTAASVPGMIYSFLMRPDGASRMPYASGALSEIFGLRPEDVIDDAAPVFSLIHPEDIGRVMATIAESARTLNPWRDEFRVRHARLGEIWVEGHSVPQREPDGSTLWHGFVQDITERKQAEAALHWKTALLEAQVNSSIEGILVVDQQGKKVLQNQRVADLFKIPRAIADGNDDAAQVKWVTDAVKNPGQFADKVAHLYLHPDEISRDEIELKDGTILDRYSAPVVGEDGKCHGRIWTFRDITERRQAETALQQERNLLRTLIDHIPDYIYVRDRSNRFVVANEAFARLMGVAGPSELIGKRDADFYPPEKAVNFDKIDQEVFAGSPVFNRERVLHFPNGQELTTLNTKVPFKNDAGKVIGLIGVGRDITERKAAEAKVADLQKQLIDASRQAGMAEVATSVLHNVGNVLNSVNISTSLIFESVKKSKAASLARVATLLQEHAHDLVTFFTQDSRGQQVPAYLGQLSRHLLAEQEGNVRELDVLRRNVEHIKEIVAMQQNYATFGGLTELVNVVTLVEDSLRMNEGAFIRHEVEIIRDFEDVPPLNVERHKILQILVNLLRNAKYACDESKRADKRLTVRVANGEGRIKISVIDNGVGIPRENLTRIFNHGFTTRKSGHGFGLHSGALAAKEMGGSLTVHSDGPGQGATFTLELPGPAQEHLPE